MDPPTYEEARLHPSAPAAGGLDIVPPPSYDASLSAPPAPAPAVPPSAADPPPAYREVVTLPPDAFPVLAPPTVTSLPVNAAFIHQTTHVGVTPPLNRQPTVVVVSQPVSSSRPVSLSHLKDVPGVVRCPYCRRVVTTKVTYRPGNAAWAMCILLTVMGLVCGICLIPFMVRGLQDAHHSCPHCGNHLHTYTR